MFFDQKLRKSIVMLLLMVSAVDVLSCDMALAADVTNGNVLNQVNGHYGADLRDVTGAKVTTDYTNATITNNNNGASNSVLNWNNLNTAQGQSLHYVMQDGYYSLNNVVGTNMYQFAGRLDAEHG